MATGQLIPNGKAGFVDANGRPLSGGKVYFYSVGTSTPKDTWQDVNQTVLNTNPIILNARGEAFIYGTGAYRQVVRDASDVLIWDAVIPDLLEAVNTAIGNLFLNAEIQVNGIVNLLALDTVTYKNAYVKSYYTGFSGSGTKASGGGKFYWDANCPKSKHDGVFIFSPTVPWDGSFVNLGPFQLGTGETSPAGIGCWVRIYETVYASFFGFVPVALTNNTVPFATLRRVALAKQPGTLSVTFTAGDYPFLTMANLAIRGLSLLFEGEVFFTNAGTGPTLLLDGGATSGLRVDGFYIGSPGAPVTLRGGSTTGRAIYARAIVGDAVVCANVHGCGTAQPALKSEWCVLVDWYLNIAPGDLTTTPGVLGWYQGGKPAAGVNLDQRLAGEQTSYCQFHNLRASACGTGIFTANTLGNQFWGGDSEFNTSQGLLTSSAISLNNKWWGTNFEVNAVDISLGGSFEEIHGCDSTTILLQATAKNCLIDGGNTDTISVTTGATDNVITNVRYGRGLGGGAITYGYTTRTRFANNTNLNTTRVENEPKSIETGTITASPVIYTNTCGNDVWVYMAGGTPVANGYVVSQGASNFVCPYPSPVRVAPGNAVQLNYTVAPTTFQIIHG
jgi:hypothetical protein